MDFSKSLLLVEQSRLSIGKTKFVQEFIDNWAFKLTGVYKPEKPFPKLMESVGNQLSMELSQLMQKHPKDDVLGRFMESVKANSSIVKPARQKSLISKLLGVIAKPKNKDVSTNSYFEDNCGTGCNAIEWLHNYINQHGIKAVQDTTLTLNDPNPLNVKCAMIQLMYYFQHIGCSPKKLLITESRKEKLSRELVSYYAEANASKTNRKKTG